VTGVQTCALPISTMLKTRVITALVMLPIVLMALFWLPAWAWAIATLGLALIALWEWSRFCRLTPRQTSAYLAVSSFASAAIAVAYLNGRLLGAPFEVIARAVFMFAIVFWLLIVPLWLVMTWRPRGSGLLAIVGWIVVLPMWFALLNLRDASPWVLLSFAAVVWVADVAAYFVGKAIGRHKLAPLISPGKSIEGVIGGGVGVAIYFFVWQAFATGSVTRNEHWASALLANGFALLAFFLVLSVVSVLGDLFESWMKRGVGMKDSSNLLPGHGGVLDRIDALTSTLPFAGLYVLYWARG